MALHSLILVLVERVSCHKERNVLVIKATHLALFYSLMCLISYNVKNTVTLTTIFISQYLDKEALEFITRRRYLSVSKMSKEISLIKFICLICNMTKTIFRKSFRNISLSTSIENNIWISKIIQYNINKNNLKKQNIIVQLNKKLTKKNN